MNKDEAIENARKAMGELTDTSVKAQMAQRPLGEDATVSQKEAAVSQHMAQAANFHAMAAAYLMGHGQEVAMAQAVGQQR